jgi:DNA (cytosine-5)-methyltransferase 1
MENVREAPIPAVLGYSVDSVLLRDHWCGGETMRLRRFSFGSRDGRRLGVSTLALHRCDPDPAALASGGNNPDLSQQECRAERRRTGRGLGNRGYKTQKVFRDHCRLQGLPDGFDLPGFTVAEKVRAVGNGVPLAMGRAVAEAVRAAIGGRS